VKRIYQPTITYGFGRKIDEDEDPIIFTLEDQGDVMMTPW